MIAARALNKTRRTRSLVGIDAGRDCVRIAQLLRADDMWVVELLASWRAPRNTPAYHEDELVADRLVRWLRQSAVRGRRAIVGLSPPDVELHAMELPLTPGQNPSEQRHAARFEVQRLMSFDDDAAEIDFWPVPESKFMSTTAIGVAALKSRLESVQRIASSARIDCFKIDVAPCALARFAAALRGAGIAADDVWGVLDLGRRMTRLILCVGETPVIARVFEYGGESWTRKVAASLSVSEAAAERHKCDQGLMRPARGRMDEKGAGARDALGAMIYSVLRSDLDAILGELERTYRYVLQCYASHRTGTLILTGGGAAMRNLDRLIADQLGIEVLVPSIPDGGHLGDLDFRPVARNVREPISSYACAIGLAISEG